MHWDWATFACGVFAGIMVAVVAWFIIFIKLMSQGDN